jgi:hypothetical protein
MTTESKGEMPLHLEQVQPQDVECVGKTEQPIQISATEEAFIRRKVCLDILIPGRVT